MRQTLEIMSPSFLLLRAITDQGIRENIKLYFQKYILKQRGIYGLETERSELRDVFMLICVFFFQF